MCKYRLKEALRKRGEVNYNLSIFNFQNNSKFYLQTFYFILTNIESSTQDDIAADNSIPVLLPDVRTED